MHKERIDILLVEKQLIQSRNLAQRMIMAGEVRVNGQPVLKPSEKIEWDALIEIEKSPQYVSRGGEKLEAALHAFELTNLKNWVCADVGASTGGFTDCLLQHGAKIVYAIDVGHGELNWKLRQDPRVVVMEKTNARYIDHLPEPIDLVVIDASFISLKILLTSAIRWSTCKKDHVVALIKPQFEAGRKDAARGEGVIRDSSIHKKVLFDILDFSEQHGNILGVMQSPLKGPKGNIEFLMHFSQGIKNTRDWRNDAEELIKKLENEIGYTSNGHEH
jgi:23S rRNA (cytidine1920-2'-O)/16S rRNA (cytidine1409-2'-O)-methyltransferase